MRSTRKPSAAGGIETVLGVQHSVLLPLVLVALIVGLDDIQHSRRLWSVPITGILDEPAHLATAGLALAAIAGWPWLRRHRAFTLAALISAMAIDLDHVAMYAGVPHIAVGGGRPFTHSLMTVLLLAAIGGLIPLGRQIALGMAAGVALHFVRDVATGPGVPLFWPFSPVNVVLPYSVYLWCLSLLAVVATVRVAASAQGSVLGTREGR